MVKGLASLLIGFGGLGLVTWLGGSWNTFSDIHRGFELLAYIFLSVIFSGVAWAGFEEMSD